MATDNSPPKIRVILTIAFSSVVILGALNFVFRSYFQMMTDEAQLTHLRPAAELIKLREGEQKNLTSGAVPIDKAIAELAAKGRGEALKDIEPQASNDMGPMVGWVRTPNQAIVARLEAEAADASAPAPAPAMSADGGAAPTSAGTDGGAAPMATDAGAGSIRGASPDAGAAPKPEQH
jgi:hypothetical protein